MNAKFFLKKKEVTKFIGILSLILRMSTALTFQIFLCYGVISLEKLIQIF